MRFHNEYAEDTFALIAPSIIKNEQEKNEALEGGGRGESASSVAEPDVFFSDSPASRRASSTTSILPLLFLANQYHAMAPARLSSVKPKLCPDVYIHFFLKLGRGNH